MDYHEGAWNALKEIQFKKLSDLECRWRTEQVINIPEVMVIKDFEQVAEKLLTYEGITLVSEDDIRLYQQFLRRKPTQLLNRINYVEYPG